MVRVLVVLATLLLNLLTLSQNAFAEEMTVQSYRKAILDARNKAYIEGYVAGIGIGVFYASLFNVNQLGEKPIF